MLVSKVASEFVQCRTCSVVSQLIKNMSLTILTDFDKFLKSFIKQKYQTFSSSCSEMFWVVDQTKLSSWALGNCA